MRRLSPTQILLAWEDGQQSHPVDWALHILSMAEPKLTWEDLVDLPIGQRDEALLRLRELIFGPRLNIYAECPVCRERLEFEFDSRQVRSAQNGSPAGSNQLEWKGAEVGFRLPTSRDLAAIAQIDNLQSARRILLERCLIEVPPDMKEISTGLQLALSERIEQLDPLGDIHFALNCPNCSHTWTLALDIPSFLFIEITGLARRLLKEVHLLAKAYGWTETDILGMSAARRRAYLEMVMA